VSPPGSYAFDQLQAPAARPQLGTTIGVPTADEINRALDQARAQGVAEGHAAGFAEGCAQIAAEQEALRAAATALAADRADLAVRAERAAVELSLRIAEQVVRSTVAAQPELILETVEGALRRLVERERVLVLVHPDDLETVRAGLGPLIDQLGGAGHFEAQAERRVARGGAVVRTVDGEIDATIETKLQRAREVLDDELCTR
jgi:flagellar assembly protein FliH